MTAHPAITHDAHEPCPFCGCGPLAAGAAKRPTRRAVSPLRSTLRHAPGLPARFRSDPNWPAVDRSGIPFGILPADWAYAAGVGRSFTAQEQADLAEQRAALAAHAGQVAIVDQRTNKITGWRNAA